MGRGRGDIVVHVHDDPTRRLKRLCNVVEECVPCKEIGPQGRRYSSKWTSASAFLPREFVALFGVGMNMIILVMHAIQFRSRGHHQGAAQKQAGLPQCLCQMLRY